LLGLVACARRVGGVHGADIEGAPVSHTEKKPQYSNDSRWRFRRLAR